MHNTKLQVQAVIQQLRIACPWNGRQTPMDLLHALETEVRELRQALDGGAAWEICGELGDALFNFVWITEWFRERGLFTLADVDKAVSDKMIARHPYVFAGMPDPGSEQASSDWEKYKAEEVRQRKAARIGISLVCDIYRANINKLSDLSILENILFGLYAVINGQPVSLSLFLRTTSSTYNRCNFVSLVDPPIYLVLQAFPDKGMVFLQGFVKEEVDAATLRKYITDQFGTEEFEIALIERPHPSHKLACQKGDTDAR